MQIYVRDMQNITHNCNEQNSREEQEKNNNSQQKLVQQRRTKHTKYYKQQQKTPAKEPVLYALHTKHRGKKRMRNKNM